MTENFPDDPDEIDSNLAAAAAEPDEDPQGLNVETADTDATEV